MAAKRASRALASSLSGVFGARVNLTVFPVRVSFIGFSLSGGNNTADVAANGVNHGQFHHANEADREKTILTIVLAVVVPIEAVGVEKYPAGVLESNTVFGQVGSSLFIVPFKA
jgi:hypothetical protein